MEASSSEASSTARVARPPRAPLEAPARETPMIGRDVELRRLTQLLEEAWSGAGRIAVVVSEAGIGKTRLVEELSAVALQSSGRAVVGRCYETEQILPFAPWVEALRTVGVVSDMAADDALPLPVRALARLFPELTPRGVDLPPRTRQSVPALRGVVPPRGAADRARRSSSRSRISTGPTT